MTDFDTAVKELLNSAVDRELAGHRVAPPLDRAALSDRSGPARRPAGWVAPVLAALVVALLVAGSIVAIDNLRARPDGRVGPMGRPTPSVSTSLSPDQEAAALAYAEAVAGAREAGEVAGVSEELAPEERARAFVNTGYWSLGESLPAKPAPGRSYPFTMDYLVGPRIGTGGDASGDGVTVVSSALRGVTAGSCPQPFLARPGRIYQIHCEATIRAGGTGTVVFTQHTSTGVWGYSFNLTGPVGP
jgi:hypothetical protein